MNEVLKLLQEESKKGELILELATGSDHNNQVCFLQLAVYSLAEKDVVLTDVVELAKTLDEGGVSMQLEDLASIFELKNVGKLAFAWYDSCLWLERNLRLAIQSLQINFDLQKVIEGM